MSMGTQVNDRIQSYIAPLSSDSNIMVAPPFYDASSRPSSPLQQERIPAWKKLGLKLKNAKNTKEVVSSTNGVSSSTLKRSSPDIHLAPTAEGSVAEPMAKKRRVESDADKPSRSSSSLARTSDTFPKDQNARLKKRVSFTAETKLEDGGRELITDWERDDYAYYEQKAAENDAKEAQKKVDKSIISSEKPSSTQGKSRDALGYLDLYYRSRSSWKFNKNREVWILRHILSTDDIPASFNIALASYVHGLGSRQARLRLLNQCQEALEKEVVKEYSGDQQDSESSQMEDPGRRKASHDDYVRRFKRSLEDHLDDEQRKAREVDPEYQLWLSERKRAEILLWAATPSTSSTAGASTSRREVRSDPQSFASVKSANGITMNGVLPNGHLFKKKNRTVVVEASSSSEDESVISDEEDNGGELVNRKGVPNGVTDSESSSDESSGAASSADSDSNEEESATVASRSRGSVSPSEDGSEADTEYPLGERQKLAISISSRSNTSTLPVSSTPDESSSSASTDEDEEQDESDSGSSTAAADTRPSMNGDGETTSSSDGEDESQSDCD